MNTVQLSRRQFMQLGAAAGWAAGQGLPHWTPVSPGSPEWEPSAQTDPFLQLALMQGFEDHAVQAWPIGMRLTVELDRVDSNEWVKKLGTDVRVHNLFHDASRTWATLSLHPEALFRLHRQGLSQCFRSHLWGAPWRHTENQLMLGSNGSAKATKPVIEHRLACEAHRSATGQRVLVIDHGFALAHLSESGQTYLHHASHAHNRPAAWAPAYSHGAQTLGLFLQFSASHRGLAPTPLLLYELPDALLGSVPLGALWPDILDAVAWGICHAQAGEQLVVLLSVVSSDGSRHPQSFVSRSARALQRHAKGLGVELIWVMAAGNQHQAQQHLRYQVRPGQAAVWQWDLPHQNTQATFLECWHDASAGAPKVMFKPPGQAWQSSGHGVISAWRQEDSGKIQTVFRLPATCSSQPDQKTALAGPWGVRWQAPGGATELDVNLSMMSSDQAGPFRQAKLYHDSDSSANPLQIQSLSGLVPHMTGVWVAQALGQGHAGWLVANPRPDQLSGYSGRWPMGHDLHGLQSAGACVDPSRLWAGLNVTSVHGHRMHRASGTSMAVPLVAAGLMSGRLG